MKLTTISDYNTLAVIELSGIKPEKTEWHGKYYAVFDQEKVNPILAIYYEEKLTANVSDFIAALRRVKDRIFAAQRLSRKAGVSA